MFDCRGNHHGSASTRLTRTAATVALATLVSRILGFLRDAVIAWYLGAGFSSDAFLAAFRIPNLFRRLVGEGTLNSAFVPVLTETLCTRGHDEAEALVRSAARVVAIMLLVACAAGILAAPGVVRLMAPGFSGPKLDITVTLARVMFPYLLAAGLGALCMGALNVYGCFAPPALTPALLNIAMIGSMVVSADWLERPALGLAAGVLIGGAVQVVFQLPFLLRRGLRLWGQARWAHPGVMRIARLMLPAVFGGAVYQLNILVGTLLASILPDGSVSYLYYADRLVEFPLGVVAMAGATALLPSVARAAALGDLQAVGHTFSWAFRLVSFITIPAAAGLMLLGEPIVMLLFKRGEFSAQAVQLTAQALSYYALGLWAFSAIRIVVAVFFAVQDSKTPVRAAAVSILANIALGLAFMQPLAHCGVALAVALASVLNLVLLLAALRKRVPGIEWRAIGLSLARSLAVTAIMSAGLMMIAGSAIPGPEPSTAGLALGLAASITAGVLIYAGSSLAVGCPELRAALAHLTKSESPR